ncbi:MAG: hypothetical protein IM585_02225 [Pseudanabaena sp. M135S2SP2A07QC]|nr:hypothetical protein [Pseudanabaena sp. M172S2SP2A07QC]MCA6526600.1 hypothetical protein [Pseudanabaena sp. M179S2SP2A07QC]MCA6529880.1 hypothetical protein [Pseudanabaena sp. M125S2SP2A07QC]MCA6532666.1 hypothetical protein [Pseudanabaena sp. M176S2SP2A07QC]MCA6539866.1 hypothetical protein [Pseudanabaena sp. M037S2SP2A07QC]MCA6545324.1 hypothetical protein [Pseudanabaena sp. M074S1SP2A07QC]MCA6547418.1 hypothetical protein [Pseudanabaena sp. M152S2SP2A07QC]MCA6550844.1 hypothetical prot
MTKRLFSNYSKNKAIALSPPTNPDRLFPQIKQRSPLTTHKTRSPISSNQTAIAPSTPTNLIAYQSIKITRLSVVNFDYWQ